MNTRMTLDEARRIAYQECLVCGSVIDTKTVSYGMSEGFALVFCPEHADAHDQVLYMPNKRYSRLLMAHYVINVYKSEILDGWWDAQAAAGLLPVFNN